MSALKDLGFEQGPPPEFGSTPELWVHERFQGAISLGFRVRAQLHQEQSPYQQIAVYDTFLHGRMLALDGVIMLTERDEFIYHELLVHVPMFTLAQARRALVIGGGDGGAVRELCKHPGLEEITLVEIDQRVVEVSKQHLPALAAGFSDPRVKLVFMDGAQFVKESPAGAYDLIVVDSTDPIGPGKVLFSREFYRDAARALKPGGALSAQTESPLYHPEVIRGIYSNLAAAFNNPFMFWGVIPTYLGGLYTFAYASASRHPLRDFQPRGLAGMDLKYYNEQLHPAGFALPRIALDCLPEGLPQKK